MRGGTDNKREQSDLELVSTAVKIFLELILCVNVNLVIKLQDTLTCSYISSDTGSKNTYQQYKWFVTYYEKSGLSSLDRKD